MEKIYKTRSTNFSFLSVLALIFITLKLIGTITWSWWWVLSPLWGPIALVLGLIFCAFIASMIISGISMLFRK